MNGLLSGSPKPPKTKRKQAPAKGKPANRLPRARRSGAQASAIVDEIVELLIAGRYFGTKTKRLLARKHALSVSTIGGYVQQAVQRTRPVAEAVEETRRATMANLELTFEKALKGVGLTRLGGELLPIDPDYKSAVAAQKTIAEVGGALARGGLTVNYFDARTGRMSPELEQALGLVVKAALQAVDEVLRDQPALKVALVGRMSQLMSESNADSGAGLKRVM